MNAFDPTTVRKAVAEFTPQRPQKFQDLAPAKEVIVELRQKRASYRAIAELLTQHCLPTSKTAIAAYCHEVLRERVRTKRRPAAKRPANGATQPEAESPAAGDRTVEGPPTVAVPTEREPPPPRGPRIARVRLLNA